MRLSMMIVTIAVMLASLTLITASQHQPLKCEVLP